MRTDFFCDIGEWLQGYTHPPLERFAVAHPNMGKLGSFAIFVIDFTVGTFGTPLVAIERASLMAFNLLGAAFSKKCSLADAFYNAKELVRCVIVIPFQTVIIDPIKFAYYVGQCAYNRLLTYLPASN